ncbi:class I SAM-dependent methyltransferase [Candidatus Woesearchaeota archaeon]|nr:class I SAM-dependent methyltransferase [Candidatus Woesearchaeota archaeon]
MGGEEIEIKVVSPQEVDFYAALLRKKLGVVPVALDINIMDAFDHQAIKNYFESEGIDATAIFEKTRKNVQGLLQAIVAHVWDAYSLPRNGVIEYGSGATGYFYARLKPEDVANWLQVEINPKAVEENRRRNPTARVVEGSYYNIPYREVPVICGLSSFDTALFMGKAIHQVAEALAPGGYFLHLQDVRPGVGCISAHVKRKTGKVPERAYIFEKETRDPIIAMCIGDEPVTVNEIFRSAISEGIKAIPGLELLVNDYVQAMRTIPGSETQGYFFNSYYRISPVTHAHQNAVMLVTLARKR